MKKILILSFIVLVIVSVSWLIYEDKSKVARAGDTITVPGPKDALYTIGGRQLILHNGISEVEDKERSSTKIVTRYFGNEVYNDFDKDGSKDMAFIMTQNSGGGDFYYLVAALNTGAGYIGSHGAFLGENIAPMSTEMGADDVIIVNFAENIQGGSTLDNPSVGKSLWLTLDPETMQFGEVVQDFVNKEIPNQMSLDSKSWNWINITYSNGFVLSSNTPEKFILKFIKPNFFSISTDCNGIGGEYIISGNKITFDKMMSTEMFCEGSQEGDFGKGLIEVEGYHFTNDGELVLTLRNNGGSMLFR